MRAVGNGLDRRSRCNRGALQRSWTTLNSASLRLANVSGFGCAGRAKRDPRLLQAVVGRPETRLQVAQAAKQDATGGSSVRGLPRYGNRVERAGRIAADCSADKKSGERNVAGGEASRRNATASERRCSQAHWVETSPTRWMPAGGQPHQPERRQAIWPSRYNHLHLGGPGRARQAQDQLNSGRNVIPAASLR